MGKSVTARMNYALKKCFSFLFYWSFSASYTTYRHLLREIAQQWVWISSQRAAYSTGDRVQSLLHLYLNIFTGWNSSRKSLVEWHLWTSGKDLNTPDRPRKSYYFFLYFSQPLCFLLSWQMRICNSFLDLKHEVKTVSQIICALGQWCSVALGPFWNVEVYFIRSYAIFLIFLCIL